MDPEEIAQDESGEQPASSEEQPSASVEAQPQAENELSFVDEPARRAKIMEYIHSDPKFKEAYGWMQSAHQKSRARDKEVIEKASMVDRFYNDPNFRVQTIQQWAAQDGLAITKAQARQIANDAASNGTVSDVPPELVQAVRGKLDPSVAWLADSIAAAHWEANKVTLAPVLNQLHEDRKEKANSEYQQLAEELATKAPGWEEHEEDMQQLAAFLQNPNQLRHPVYGSKLEILYNIKTGGARATQEAINRMAQAGRNRSGVGAAGRQSAPDLSEKIRNAKNDTEAFEIAAQDALAKLGT